MGGRWVLPRCGPTPAAHEGWRHRSVPRMRLSLLRETCRTDPLLCGGPGVQFYPDHGFFYDMMPSFSIKTGAQSVGHLGIRRGRINDLPEEWALAFEAAIRVAGFDPTFSYRVMLDDGFTQFEVMLTASNSIRVFRSSGMAPRRPAEHAASPVAGPS
jgi:hypothetical protein